MNNLRALVVWGAVGFAAIGARAAQANVLTFQGIKTGTFLGSQYFASDGVLIGAVNNNPNHPDVATVFNTNKTGTPDSDLQYDWAGGNLEDVNLSKIMIIAENAIDGDHNGKIDKPDDEAKGGTIYLSFSKPVSSIGFDLVDLDVASRPNSIEFFNNGVSVGTFNFGELTDSTSAFYDSSIVFGNHTANRVEPLSAAELGIPDFNSVAFHLAESMGIDNVNFTYASPVSVPEPSLALFSALPILLAPQTPPTDDIALTALPVSRVFNHYCPVTS